ncbi:MAG: HAMP domain-containing sensor histidine kinase [Pseudoflavonifractor sp.]
MKTLKLFPKIFLYTLLLMVFITTVALGTTYFLGTAPMGSSISVSVGTSAVHVTPAPSESAALTSQLIPLEPTETSAFYSINSDTNVAIPAMNVVPSLPAETLDAAQIIPSASYSLVRFGNLVGGAIAQAIPLVAVVCLLLSALCALLFSRMIAGPIRGISAATEQMSALVPEALCPVQSGDEIGMLAEHVNALYESLLATIHSLEEEKQRVEASEKSKVDFLRAASHELKTPVTALSATLENMVLGVGSYRDYETYLPRCKAMCDRLSGMVCEILDASRAPALEPATTFSLAHLLDDLCAPYAELAAAEGLVFTAQTAAPGSFCLPAQALKQALGNVLGNAVTYTPQGGRVSVNWDGRTLTAENTCTPLTTEQLGHIFEAFYRPDWGRDRADGGNGLGLYISAGILDRLGLSYRFLPNENKDGMIFSVDFTQD